MPNLNNSITSDLIRSFHVISMAMAYRASQEWLRLIRDSEPEMTTPVIIDPPHLTAWIRMMIASAFHPQVFRKANLTGKDLSLGEANSKPHPEVYNLNDKCFKGFHGQEIMYKSRAGVNRGNESNSIRESVPKVVLFEYRTFAIRFIFFWRAYRNTMRKMSFWNALEEYDVLKFGA